MTAAVRVLFALLLLVAVATISSPEGFGPAVQAADEGFDYDAEVSRGQDLVQSLGIAEALGPLAPVALSPFFALTCLSGASLLAQSGMMPDFIANNPMIGTNSVLGNGFVFSGLLLLSLATAAPKLTKVTKPFAQAIDQIEAHAGIISIVAVQLLSQMHLGEPSGGSGETASMVVYQAGIVSFTSTTLIAVFSAINIFVVNTVKFFFEVLIWLSPFPGVDAAFEAANKAVVGALVAVYVFSPWAAAAINLLIFFVSLIIFAWAFRRVVYMKGILGDPILGWTAESVFGRPPVTATSTALPRSVEKALGQPRLALKAFAGRAFQGLKKKTRGYLVATDEGVFFAKPRCLRAPLIVRLPRDGHRVEVAKGFLSNTVRFLNDAGDATMTVLLTRRYNPILEEIEAVLGASEASAAAGPKASDSVMEVSREIGAAIRSGGKDAIRAELA